jgi:hypothetical protein
VPDDALPLRESARRHLADSAGIADERAATLLDAAVRAATLEVVDSLANDAPSPSSISDLRALRLFRISLLLDSTPSADEVGALFRVPLQMARTIIRRMEASYPTIRERDLMSAVARVRSRPSLMHIKGEAEDWYLVAYPDQHDLEAFLAKLRRLGVSDIRPVPDDDLARAIPKETPTGANVLDELQLKRPADEP